MIKKDSIKLLYILLPILIIVSIILSISASMNLFQSFRITFGSVFVLFIPGFVLSYVFFPKTKELTQKLYSWEEKSSIDWLERIALSFALSIAIVPLTIFYLNLIGIKITALNSFIIISLIIIITLIFLTKKSRKNEF